MSTKINFLPYVNKYIMGSTNNQLLWYGIILAICLILSFIFNVTISNIVFLGIGLIIIYYLYQKQHPRIKCYDPQPKYLSQYPDIVNYLNKLQNQSNQSSQSNKFFSELVTTLNNFFRTYQKILSNPDQRCNLLFDKAQQLYYKNLELVATYENAIDIVGMRITKTSKLKNLLQKYLDELSDKCEYDEESLEPRPFNYYHYKLDEFKSISSTKSD